jgi:zinc carboxypeptidase
MPRNLRRLVVIVVLGTALAAERAPSQAPVAARVKGAVTSPKEHFGFNMGDDYCLANYKQFESYLRKIETQTDRLKVVNIGKTEEGRDQLMAIVTSPANHKRLDRLRDISRKLARAEGVSPEEASKLAEEGKAVIWIDGGLHASEVLCAQALVESIYQFVTATDPEALRILDDVVILFVHCNPDGHDLVADWYMRDKDPKRRSLQSLPTLYEKYAGHDNNRDFYAANLAETRNMNRVMYREWFPQIVLNHHQTGPPGAVMFVPPCRDPFNYNIHPLVINGIERVSHAMVERFLEEEKPGVTIRTGARYSTWFNGGLSTACQFHNMIGLFTETIGNPTQSRIPLLTNKLLPGSDYLAPIAPQEWHFRQSVDYLQTANRALLDYASRNRRRLLHNIWTMGRQSIERGGKDNWSVTPRIVKAAGSDRAAAPPGPGGDMGGMGERQGRPGFAQGRPAGDFVKFFKDPANRDARGYIIPADQPDFPTATKFVNTLIGTGVIVHRAKSEFAAGGKKYPAGSFVVNSAQAFRAHVFDMFEPQDHPDDFAAGSTTPTPPYDMAGWTLAFQMGVKFDRLLDGFEGPFEELTDAVKPAPAKVTTGDVVVGYFLDTRMNDSFRAANRLLAAGEEVRRLRTGFTVDGKEYPAGTFFVASKSTTRPLLEKLARELGTPFVGVGRSPADIAPALKPVRVGLWDRYGGSMPAGWTRMILEQFEFPFQVVYPPQLDRGGLKEMFDVIVFVDGAMPGRGGAGGFRPKEKGPDRKDAIPEEYRGRSGSVTADITVPHLKEFLKEGGTILTIGSSTNLATLVGVPLGDHLVTKDAEGKERPLGRDKFYVPGSLLRARVDSSNPLAWGMDEEIDVMFASSPVFKFPSESNGFRRIAWYDTKTPLKSGWAWGQEQLAGGVAIAEAEVGKGKLILCGPQILFRAQPHGTFKFLFNAIVEAGAKE